MPGLGTTAGTPSKKPPAASLKLRLARTPLEQRSGSKPLAPSAQRRSTVRKETDEIETGQRPKPIPVRRGRGQKSEMTTGARRGEARMLGPSDGAGATTPSIRPNLSKGQSPSPCDVLSSSASASALYCTETAIGLLTD